MQPDDDDAQLRGLLREWQAPETPQSLERRVLGSRAKASWWRFLIGGYIRVPVSVACGVALLLTIAVWRVSVRPPAPCVAEQTVAPVNRVARTSRPDRCDHPAPGVC
jgi:hypothetical protein